jgi:hypothetical protein
MRLIGSRGEQVVGDRGLLPVSQVRKHDLANHVLAAWVRLHLLLQRDAKQKKCATSGSALLSRAALLEAFDPRIQGCAFGDKRFDLARGSRVGHEHLLDLFFLPIWPKKSSICKENKTPITLQIYAS